MKSKLKKLTMASTLSLIAGYASMASAHDVSNKPIGAVPGATDFYQVTCGLNTARLEINLHVDTAGGAIVSLQAQKGVIAKNTTDAVGGDAGYSPLLSVPGGVGVYNVLVDKKRDGARQYDISYHCKSGSNAHTDTSITQKQDQ
ncbi:MAG: hypothetical protein LUO94_01030 [Methylococcaceae bacterium]|nr:hypothetical protein [Methylococcaceae bacterium]